MKNDQIKSQIENAKKAFVAGKEREQEASLADVSKDEAKVQEHSAHEERQLQEAIMTRVQGLMEEASKSSGVQRSVPINPGHLSSESRSKPFWAQNRVDIPPSEQFGKRQKMQEQDNPGESKPLGKMTETNLPETETAATQSSPDPLTAIRQEVFNKLGNGNEQAEELQELMDRLQRLESRADKQQQDLTALLKLVRQLANKQADLEQEKGQPRRQTRLFSSLIILLFLILVGSAGWLYFINPDLMINLSSSVLNNSFDFVLNLIARFGLL